MRIIESKYQRPLNLLTIGSDGGIAAASSTFGAAGDIEVWGTTDGTRRCVHREPGVPLQSLAFHPNGHTLFFSRHERVAVLDTTTGISRGVRGTDHFPEVAVSPAGTRLLVSENQDTDLQTADGEITCHAIGSQFDLTQLWGIDSDSVPLFHPTFNVDESRFAVTARDTSGARVRNAVQLRDSAGKLLVTIPLDPASPVHQLAFTADGAKVLVRTDSNKVQLFDAATGSPAGELAHKGRPFVTAVAVHPRGPVACARTDGTVTFWDAEKRAQLRTLDWKAGRLVSVAFGPDGSLAAAGTEDGKIVVWDVDL
jgi:WD40 repeat protein